MKLDKENVIIICIAVALLVVWALVYPNYQKKRAEEFARNQKQAALAEAQFSAEHAQKTDAPAVVDNKTATAAAPAAPVEAGKIIGERFYTLSNDKVELKIDVMASALESVTLKNFYFAGKDEKKPLTTSSKIKYKSLQPVMADAKILSAAAQKVGDNALRITTKWSNGLELVQQITLQQGSYVTDVQYTLINPGKAVAAVPEFQVWSAGVPPTQYLAGDKIYSERHNIDWHIAGSKSVVSGDPDAKEAKFKALSSDQHVDWAGSTNKFFASILFLDKVNAGLPGGTCLDRTYHAKPEK